MAKMMSKSELIQKIADQHADGMTRKDVKTVIEAVAEIGHKELKPSCLPLRSRAASPPRRLPTAYLAIFISQTASPSGAPTACTCLRRTLLRKSFHSMLTISVR
jgi:hypothetical protein